MECISSGYCSRSNNMTGTIQQLTVFMSRLPVSRSAAVLFRSKYVFRSLNGTMAVIVPLLMSVIFGVLSEQVLKAGNDLLVDFVRFGFSVGAVVFGGCGPWTLWAWIGNRDVRVEISEDGIVSGNRFWPWRRVRLFAGMRYSNGVCLAFTPRAMMWGGCDLPTTPLLTEQQYIDLAREVSQRIAVRFPDLEVALQPLDPS
jgi:hypothetical protein